MKVSDYVVRFFKDEGIDTVFGYQGGAITHIVDSISKDESVRFISSYHEQASAFQAEGYARVGGNMGVAIATSGPGATNLLTGICSCFFDSIPCLFITGQVNTYEYKRSTNIRQEGFQETDIVSMAKPITKLAYMIKDPNEVRFYLEKAAYLAKSLRPGPVLLDIPMDIQRQMIKVSELRSYYDSTEYHEQGVEAECDEDAFEIEAILELLQKSKRPVILVGGGVRIAKANNEVRELIERTNIPVVASLMGLDAIDHEIKEYAGFIGAYGNRYANLAVANADLLLVFGSRLTSRQTSPKPETFARAAKVIHIDIDESEINRTVKATLSIKADLKNVLTLLNRKIADIKYSLDYHEWNNKVKEYKVKYPSYKQEALEWEPNKIVGVLGSILPEEAIICADVGQNQMWIAQSMKLKYGQRLLNSGGMGAMGFALPSAIGAYYANPKATLVAIAGDGGIQMNIQELQTIRRENIPIKIFVINNKALGMIRHFQEMYFDANYAGTLEGYTSPNFIDIGKAYGLETVRIDNYEELEGLKAIMKDKKSYLIEVNLQTMTYLVPKLSMGRPIEDQDPLLPRDELQENMIIELLE